MINLDPNGEFRYNQLKGEISPKESCNVNSMCCAYECKYGSVWPSNVKNYMTAYNRIPDKLIYFLRFETVIRELYKCIAPAAYSDWIKDKTRNNVLYSDNSIPPNEVMKVLCIGFNLFMNNNNGDIYTNYCELKELTVGEIKKCLDNKQPIVSSFNLNGYGHIMTVVGYNETGFIVNDSYGMSYLKNHKDIGKAKEIPFKEFEKINKPTNSNKKLCIVF